nr:MAG TPA: hypothetical protein [Caudoviricetes sp.]
MDLKIISQLYHKSILLSTENGDLTKINSMS